MSKDEPIVHDFSHNTDEEMREMLVTPDQIAGMTKVMIDEQGRSHRIADYDKQVDAVDKNYAIAVELNVRAVARQNEEGAKQVCWGNPIAYESGNTDYLEWMHIDCADKPDGWNRMMMTEENKAFKCKACGYPIDKTLGN
jgi:hypothetical protein